MENFTLPSTTNTTNLNNNTLYNQQQTLTSPNQHTPNHLINQPYTYAPPSVMSHPNFHTTPHYLQPYYQNVQFPYGHLYGDAVPVAFLPYPYHVEGSGMVNAQPNLSQPMFPDRFLLNEHIGHTVQRPHSSIPKSARSKKRSNQTNSSSGSSSVRVLRKTGARGGSSNGSNGDPDPYTFCTPDNRKLRILVQKELTSSDVGSAGRIVLPRREAEKNLPSLSSNEGIQLVMRDVLSTRQWEMRYRFWSNYKGKMYVLNQIGDFVGQNRLEIGDCLTIYEDESKNLYFSIRKIEEPAQEPSSTTAMDAIQSSSNITFIEELTDEETSSLKILVEELKHTDEEANSLTTLLTFSNPMNQQYMLR